MRLRLTVFLLAASVALPAAAADSLPSLFENPGPDALTLYVDRVALPRDTGVAILRAWDRDGRHALTADAALRFARRDKLDVGTAGERGKTLAVLTPQGRVERLPAWIAELHEEQREALDAAAKSDHRAEVRGSTTTHLDRRVAPALEDSVKERRRAADLGALADALQVDLDEARGEASVP